MTTATLHPAAERFHTAIGWLDSWHSFSFGEHYDPERQEFRSLRVINDDRIAVGGKFGTHGHRDMEIITWVLSGAVEHRDSLGSGGVIRRGDAQRMSAGTGIRHSEANPLDHELHLLQIWIEPDRAGHQPSYEQKRIDVDAAPDRWHVIASPDGRDGSLTIHQDAVLRVAVLRPGARLAHDFAPGRHAWIHVARGAVTVDGQSLRAGDAVSSGEAHPIAISASADAEVLLFDLA